MHGVSTLVASMALLSTPVFGHMIMTNPKPYGLSSLQNGPLDPSGSDFPCKQRPGVYDLEGASNIVAIGDVNQLETQGGATHGGGSCQISLTTDLQPTKNSKWMVIKSIEGGCPNDAPGNLGGDASAPNPQTFSWSVPEGIAPGDYTLSWTWFNKIGNREMYQNCAPLTVTGAKKKRYNPNPIVRRQSSFPAMYVANIAGVGSTCKTTEGSDYVFPSAGDDVEKSGAGPFLTLDAGCMGGSDSVAPSTPQQGTGGDSGSAASPATSSAPAATSAATATGEESGSGTDETPTTATAGVFASNAADPPVATVVPEEPAATEAAAPASTGTADRTTTGGSSTGSTGECTPGEWSCAADGLSFQQCTMSGWAVSMSMAEGTKCEPGVTSAFAVLPARAVVRRDFGLFQRYE